MLSGFQIGMPQHFGDGFDRYAVSKRNSGRESMPGSMKGKKLGNIADIGNFFQVSIHFLITENGQHLVLMNALRMVGITANNGQRRR